MAAVPSLVTAGIDATLSKSQPQEHPTSLEDGWRHVEDDPLQLNSSADHGKFYRIVHQYRAKIQTS